MCGMLVSTKNISHQSSYLAKEESITGGFGIEGRYPFLDKAVVQEFLWLEILS